jgi:hypothetical protein
MIISRSVLLRMRNASEKFVEKIETHISCSVIFAENRAVYEVMWKNAVEPEVTDENTAYEHYILDT